MPLGQNVTVRILIRHPLPGVTYSLQNKKSEPVEPITPTEGPISFDVEIRVAEGPRYLGEFVRSEGPARRFIYIASGQQAGQQHTHWSRRAKIDIHQLDPKVLADGLDGRVIAAEFQGQDKDGGPMCGTILPTAGWRAVG